MLDPGEHYVDLWCGSPAQRQTLIINTGGHGTAFPCATCHDGCGEGYHVDEYFEQSDSFTYHQLTCDECLLGTCSTADDPSRRGTCEFGLSYEEGSSWLAVEAVDHCYIGGLHNKPESIDPSKKKNQDDLDPEHAVSFAFDLHFGCQNVITGMFQTQLADGILAMDNSPLSFWEQMYQAGKLTDRAFSLCYARQPHAWKNGTESGAMTLGGSDDRLHLHPMVFSHHEDIWERNYGVLLRKIYLRKGGGGDSAKSTDPALPVMTLNISTDALNDGNVIIESGTTDTYMSKELAGPFQEAWKQLVGSDYDTFNPYVMTKEAVQDLPTILLQFQGAEDLNKQVKGDVVNLASEIDPDFPFDIIIAMPPNHYMELLSEDEGWMARFFMQEHPSGTSILGANAMMGHDILFDAVNHRIGWAESHCDYTHMIEEAGFEKSDKDESYEPRKNHNNAYSSGTDDDRCSKWKCKAPIFILLVSVVGAFFGWKQTGAVGPIVRRLTGRVDYSGMSALDDGTELELQVSYPNSHGANWD